MNKFFALSLFVAFALLAPAVKADEEVEPQVSDKQEVEPLADKSVLLEGYCSSTTDFIVTDLKQRSLSAVPEPLMAFLNNTAASHKNLRDELVKFVQNPGEGFKRFQGFAAEQQKSLGQKLLQAPAQAGEQLGNLVRNLGKPLNKLLYSLEFIIRYPLYPLYMIPYIALGLTFGTAEGLKYDACAYVAFYNWKIIRRFEKLESENPIVSGTEIDDIPCFLIERIRATQRVCSKQYNFVE